MWKIRPFAQKSDFLDKYQTKFDQISAKGLIIRPKSDKSDRLGSTELPYYRKLRLVLIKAIGSRFALINTSLISTSLNFHALN